MKVREVMVEDVEACTPSTSLASAVEILWRRDCGVLPVLDAQGRVVGIVTDRDIAIALGTRGRRAPELTAGEAMTSPAHACGPEDDIRKAIEIMKAHRVRRVPVVDPGGRLAGIVSVHDLARAAKASGDGVSYADLANVMKAIGQPYPTRPGPFIAGGA